jgi:ribosome biogenesis GTPase
VDQSVLVATLKEPKTSQGFIDRFLVACEMYHVPAVIVFNKADLYKTKEQEKYTEWKQMYEAIGYKVILMSVHDRTGIDEVIELLKDKISLLSGHSGVGKSSFINVICPDIVLKTQDVSEWSGKGLHTTTFAEMYDLSPESYRDGGKIIDTPGMREFGLVNISKQEVSHYFPEMRDRLNDCQFNNCMHVNELDCAIKKAIEKEEINIDRYISYLKILDTINEKKY